MRTAYFDSQKSFIFFYTACVVTVNIKTDYVPKQHQSAGPCEAVKNKLLSAIYIMLVFM